MPKKTKKQKIAADKRKSISYTQDEPIHSEIKTEEKKVVHVTQKNLIFTENPSTHFFKKDLTKSLFISFFIILVEIVVYLAQNKVIPITNLF